MIDELYTIARLDDELTAVRKRFSFKEATDSVCKQFDLSCKQLAIKLGVSKSYFAQLRSGRYVSLRYVKALHQLHKQLTAKAFLDESSGHHTSGGREHARTKV